MNRILLLLTLSFLTGLSVFAQDMPSGKDGKKMSKEIREFKLKYLAQEMELTEEQQKPFFELYTQLMDEYNKTFRQVKVLKKKIKSLDSPSDKDYEALSKATSDAKAKAVEIERNYDTRFAEFLTQKQIYKMKDSEEKFRKKVREMRKKKKSGKSKRK